MKSCLISLVLFGLIGTNTLAQVPTQLPTIPETKPEMNRADLLRALIKIHDVRESVEVLKGLGKIKAYVDTQNEAQNNALQDAVQQIQDQKIQDWTRQQLIDKLQDEARKELKIWMLEKWMEGKLRERVVQEVIPTPQPVAQYLPQPQYVQPQPQYVQPQYTPQPRAGCGGQNLSVRVGLTARKRLFGNSVVLKPTIMLQ